MPDERTPTALAIAEQRRLARVARAAHNDMMRDLSEFARDMLVSILRMLVTYRLLVLARVTQGDVAFVTALGAGAADIFTRSAHWMPRTRARVVKFIRKIRIL